MSIILKKAQHLNKVTVKFFCKFEGIFYAWEWKSDVF